ncbi:aromatic ring-hydroxylating dioxygenase subunit alpha [Achromobacter spanius]|uniref:aromatic ring-hydroxylating dioxygenase subunit alpha n=1 Tax=Achromobacter spanius TaxID=217203 RepID=UPI003209ABF8
MTDEFSPEGVGRLVEPDRVHRDLYTDPAVYAAEQMRLWTRAWVYVGHESQVPAVGDYYTTEIAGQSLVLLRKSPDEVVVLMNRCAHKGSQLVHERQGNCGKVLRCPYHAWTYRLDGSLLSIPLKNDYEGTNLAACPSGKGLSSPGGFMNYKGFVFVRISEDGLDFATYFGEVLATLDNMVARAPDGQLSVLGPPLRNRIACNWKLYLENVNDTVHPISTHESAASAAKQVAETVPEGADTVLAMEQLLPFGAGYSFYSEMGARVLPHGHSVLGTKFSIHTGYAPLPDYQQELEALHGKEDAQRILQFSPQNTVLYPSLAAKASPMILRVVRPLAVNETLIEIWAFAPRTAPARLRQRAASYARLVFSPMSVVAHDDVHLFESQQRGLLCDGNEWLSLHRGYRDGEIEAGAASMDSGNNEWVIRNQHRGWLNLMGDAA